MAIPERKQAKEVKTVESEEVDPDTFLFEDDEDEDTSDLPPERESTDDDDW